MSSPRREVAVAGGLFVCACLLLLPPVVRAGSVASFEAWLAAIIVITLSACYLALSLTPVRNALHAAAARSLVVQIAGPAVLTAIVSLGAVAGHRPTAQTAAPYGLYLFAPLLLMAAPRGARADSWWRPLLAAVLLWVPLVLWLPRVRLPGGFEPSHVVAVICGLYVLLVVGTLERVGYSFALGGRDVRIAGLVFVAYASVAIPIGLATGFLVWHPRLDLTAALLAAVRIYLLIALPEEFLFRGVLQNLLTRRLGTTAGLLFASVIFGASHMPDPRYIFLAILAGIAYGWVYERTGRITASAVTHAAVDWLWWLAFQG